MLHRPTTRKAPSHTHMAPRTNILITAGPTHEPIDAVRFIGNRSSGRLGLDLAAAAHARALDATLLLGPTHLEPNPSHSHTLRFRSTAELQALLAEQFLRCDILIMAAAVADYRPINRLAPDQKLTRENRTLTIELESTPDLLAHCASKRSPSQTLVGFALEPRDRLHDSARAKLKRKSVDAIVANPLETMESPSIEATIHWSDGKADSTGDRPIPKHEFAAWLLDRVLDHHAARRS